MKNTETTTETTDDLQEDFFDDVEEVSLEDQSAEIESEDPISETATEVSEAVADGLQETFEKDESMSEEEASTVAGLVVSGIDVAASTVASGIARENIQGASDKQLNRMQYFLGKWLQTLKGKANPIYFFLLALLLTYAPMMYSAYTIRRRKNQEAKQRLAEQKRNQEAIVLAAEQTKKEPEYKSSSNVGTEFNSAIVREFVAKDQTSSKVESISVIPFEKPQTTKKKGRPRKHPLPDPNAPAKKRGRPKKEVNDAL